VTGVASASRTDSQPLSASFLIFHWDPGLKSMAILLTASFSCGRRQGYHFIHPYLASILTPCPSFPCVHPYNSVLLRNSRSQGRQRRGKRGEVEAGERNASHLPLLAAGCIRAAARRSVRY